MRTDGNIYRFQAACACGSADVWAWMVGNSEPLQHEPFVPLKTIFASFSSCVLSIKTTAQLPTMSFETTATIASFGGKMLKLAHQVFTLRINGHTHC